MSQITMYAGEVNSPYTLLSAGIDSDDTTIAVLELGVFPTAPNIAVLGSGSDAETILYTGKSAASGAGNLTGVTRAWNTTGSYGAAKSWIAGTVIARRFTAYDHDTFKANIEDLAARSVATDAIFDAAGDLIVGTGANTAARLAKGTANQILHVKSDGSTLEWTAAPSGDVATDAIWDAAGDLAVGTGANTAGRLAVGSAGQYLKVAAGGTSLEWGTISGGGDVLGPASSTDNTIARFNGTDNKTIQGSLVTIDDNGSVNVPSGQAYKINGTALAASDVGAATTSTKLDDFAAPDDNTDLNASTSAHGLLVKATAPAAGLRNVVGIDNSESAYTNKALFDATDPAMNGSASPGSAMTAARRDHVHASDTSRAPANPLATDSLWDAAGDLVVGSGANTAAKLSKGTANQVLHVKSDGSTLEWADPAAGTGDVVGPASSINNYYAVFDGVTGKLLKYASLYEATSGVSLPPGSTYQINGSALTYSNVGAAPANPLATDSLWDAAGDLVVGTGSNTAGKVAKGSAYQVLRMKSDASTVEWGAPVVRLAAVTGSITFNTTSNDDGVLLTAVDLGANAGLITRIRIWANQTLGQRTAGTFLINDGDGISPTDTSLAYDGLVGTLPTAGNEATGDYVWIDNELCRVSAGTSTPLTLVRGLCGTLAAFHDDNAIVRTANEGLRLKLFSANAESEANQIFELTRILTGTFTTDAAISAGDKVLTLSSSPTVLSDWGRGDPFIIDDTADEINYVQALYGSVSGTTYDDSIVPQNTLAAHDNTKTVYRVVEYSRPIPFKLATTATNLYVSLQAEQLLPGNATVYYEFLIEKWG